MMGFMDKAKAAAEQAATRAREGVEDVQSKRSLAHAYEQLGRTAFDLLEAGEISHERLVAQAAEIRGLQAGAPADPVGTGRESGFAPPGNPD
jgi:hypothetical protein